MTLIAIIQARQNSSRFPGKVLSPLCGVPILHRVIEATRAGCPRNTKIIVATSTSRADDPIAAYVPGKCALFRGSEIDVLERFFQCASEEKAKHVVRISCDCPLLDPTLLRSTIGDYYESHMDYAGVYSNEWGVNGPDGVDHEVFSFAALEAARANAIVEQREHVTLWIRENRKVLERPSLGFTDAKFSVNDLNDLRHVERLLTECGEGQPYRVYAELSARLRLAERRAARPPEPVAVVLRPDPVPVTPESDEQEIMAATPAEQPRKGLIERWFK